MSTLNYSIEIEDLKVLMIKSIVAYKNTSFENFVIECKQSYSDYYNRNMSDLKKWGQPKSFSQWVNGQIIALG